MFLFAPEQLAPTAETRPTLRPYQRDALAGIVERLQTHGSTLVVMPTGTGKTVLFAEAIRTLRARRAMVIAHREELVFQAVRKITHAGIHCSIEMAGHWADEWAGKATAVVSTVQTQCSGVGGAGRMTRFAPDDFDLLIIDEAHHATADSYRRVIAHYRKNRELKVLGVTATPDRADEAALGNIFESVAYDYEIVDAIQDGWIVPIRQTCIRVVGLDYSQCRTTAGDLNGADLARIVEEERHVQAFARPIHELSAGRRTLAFAATVRQAEMLADVLCRIEPGCARIVHGGTPSDERRTMLADYSAGRFQVLCNVGIATEGFDEPGIAVVAMCAATKSRAKYAQCAGRGTRPLPGIVDPHHTDVARRQAITDSGKPYLELIDFVGNSGRHKLMSAADILGGKLDEEVVERAKRKLEQGETRDVQAALFEAERDIEHEAEEKRERERQRRRGVVARVDYSQRSIDPFDVFDLPAPAVRGWGTADAPTEKQVAFLSRQGIATDGWTKRKASVAIGTMIGRNEAGLCSLKQAALLSRYGYAVKTITRTEASKLIDALKANGWRRP